MRTLASYVDEHCRSRLVACEGRLLDQDFIPVAIVRTLCRTRSEEYIEELSVAVATRTLQVAGVPRLTDGKGLKALKSWYIRGVHPLSARGYPKSRVTESAPPSAPAVPTRAARGSSRSARRG